jgi:hypothetical protein
MLFCVNITLQMEIIIITMCAILKPSGFILTKLGVICVYY